MKIKAKDNRVINKDRNWFRRDQTASVLILTDRDRISLVVKMLRAVGLVLTVLGKC